MSKRIFKYKSDEYWSVFLEDKTFRVECSSEKEAKKACEKLIKEKLQKGYIEVTELVEEETFGRLMENLQIPLTSFPAPDNTSERLAEKLDRFTRRVWRPVVKNSDGPVTASKFSGTPYLAGGERWPLCPGCHNQFQFFFQLNLSDLPAKIKDDFDRGLIQLFYCSTCCSREPFSDTMLVRLVQPSGRGKKVKIPDINYLPPKLITGWKEVNSEIPNFEELEKILEEEDICLDEEEKENIYRLASPELGDKLGGWPYWMEGVEYPSCPFCNKPMRLVFQIDSEDNLSYSFGDGACAHITQCQEHKEQLAFGWSCC